MVVRIYDENPSPRHLERVADLLERGGVVIIPTGSLYAFGCSLLSARGVERMQRLRGKDPERMSVVFASIGQAAEYCKVDDEAFRILRRNLPGPFTFILNTSSRVPSKAAGKRRTIGVRIPDSAVARAIVERLGAPLLVASMPVDEAEPEYATHPGLIDERYGSEVDLVIDGGMGGDVPTTVVDLTTVPPEIIREGGGTLE